MKSVRSSEPSILGPYPGRSGLTPKQAPARGGGAGRARLAAVDPFGLIVGGALLLLLVAVLLLGLYHPKSGAEILDWRPTRSPETEIELELDDIDQMLEAQNARRRRRGQAELTEHGLRADVAREQAELDARAAEYRDRRPGAPGDLER